MNRWRSQTVCSFNSGTCNSNLRYLHRCALTVLLAALISGCSWLWPAPEAEPEREPVQYSDAPLPPTPAEPVKVVAPELPSAPGKTAHDQVTVLPNKDGSVGAVVVRQDGVAIVLDKAYATALVEGPGLVTESTYDADLAQQQFADVLASLPAEPARFTVYFLEGRDDLSPDSEAEIEKIVADLATRSAAEISLIGHTDAVGSAEYNDKLSLQRAEHVRAELISRGVPEASISVSGRGKRELLIPTADGIAEPQNRRVEINVQ
jgi:outer membrane protein OmpA-like peptidoglycan-associated protein